MRGRRWFGVLVVVALGGATLTVLPALGQTEIIVPAGVLHLHMNSDGDRLVFDPVGTGSNLTQGLGIQGACALKSTGPATLAGFSANEGSKNPYPGLKDHRIGVGQTGEGNGEPCARINKDLAQSMTFSLAGSLAGMAIDYAEIDLGFKFDADIVLELRRDGALVDSVTIDCSPASDCGPDSGANDNERVILYVSGDPGSGHWQKHQVNGAFDSITIMPGGASSNGAVSLEGGFSGLLAGPLGVSLGTTDSLFRVVEAFDGQIDCGDSESLGDDNVTFDVTRGQDTNGECKGPADGLLFNFDSGTLIVDGEELLFVDFVTEPVDSDPATVAQYLEVITWEFDDPPNVPGGDPQHLTLLYDDHLGAGVREMPWCEMDPRDAGGSLPTGTVASPFDPSTVLPDGHTSCLISSSSRVTMLGDWLVEDTVYNIGDGLRMR